MSWTIPQNLSIVILVIIFSKRTLGQLCSNIIYEPQQNQAQFWNHSFQKIQLAFLCIIQARVLVIFSFQILRAAWDIFTKVHKNLNSQNSLELVKSRLHFCNLECCSFRSLSLDLLQLQAFVSYQPTQFCPVFNTHSVNGCSIKARFLKFSNWIG